MLINSQGIRTGRILPNLHGFLSEFRGILTEILMRVILQMHSVENYCRNPVDIFLSFAKKRPTHRSLYLFANVKKRIKKINIRRKKKKKEEVLMAPVAERQTHRMRTLESAFAIRASSRAIARFSQNFTPASCILILPF